jgi:hypothetical protein
MLCTKDADHNTSNLTRQDSAIQNYDNGNVFSEGRRPPGRPSVDVWINTDVNHKEIECEEIQQALVNVAIKLRTRKKGRKFLEHLSDYYLLMMGFTVRSKLCRT